jgi:hypothetical protein
VPGNLARHNHYHHIAMSRPYIPAIPPTALADVKYFAELRAAYAAAAASITAAVTVAAAARADQYWQAPGAVARLQQWGGPSSWGVYLRGYRAGRADFVALPINHEPDEMHAQPGGRTPGRALRHMRRFLRRNPLAFA